MSSTTSMESEADLRLAEPRNAAGVVLWTQGAKRNWRVAVPAGGSTLDDLLAAADTATEVDRYFVAEYGPAGAKRTRTASKDET